MDKQTSTTKEVTAVTPTVGTVHETGKGKLVTDTLGPITQTIENDTQLQENNTENTKVAPVQPEEQLPGQKNIEDYPQYLPDSQAKEKEEFEEKEKPVPKEIPQNAPDTVIKPKLYKKGEPREAITHYIKCSAMFFEDAAAGRKNFELRINDRDYRVGDILHMTEHKDGHNTGRFIEQEIIYMLEEFNGLKEDYCILGTKSITGIEQE
ncbi:DUF3850 domain-containing protein [Lachnotalea glycerini]|uniref:DUF3850 domain-containing protein n=2 Tax=Lachnotalea glycerini TaxID=1763509 RepID=A0A371JC39_9FIRM|nr:DUF3850 domain-containing protein [Lachnotalea glycerini]